VPPLDPSENPTRQGQGSDNMARIYKGPHAPSEVSQPTGMNRSEAGFPVFVCVERLQVSNVPAHDPISIGVQVPPKLSTMLDCAERGTPGPSPSGQANRKAGCGRSGLKCLHEVNARLHGRDTECNILGSGFRVRSLLRHRHSEYAIPLNAYPPLWSI